MLLNQKIIKEEENKFLNDSNNSLLFELINNKFENTEQIKLKHKKTLLLNADVLEENLFDKEYFDLIVTSPPYNVDIQYNSHKDDLTYEEYLEFSEAWMRNCLRWTKQQGRFCLNIPLDKNKGGQKSVGADLTALAQKVGWNYHSTIIWNEGN
ncbi:MAG TPA: DNA methyltransferase, partial [Candidatus Kapabacteria bacterium]|nr:DNA methyltransferase [Candidatus Kapabacteria bacterium]